MLRQCALTDNEGNAQRAAFGLQILKGMRLRAKVSQIGTLLMAVLFMPLAFQNCAPSAGAGTSATPVTPQSLTVKRDVLEDEGEALVALVFADLSCRVDAQCEELWFYGACPTMLPSSLNHSERPNILKLLRLHRQKWRDLQIQMAAYPEMSWNCVQGFIPKTAFCNAGRCDLKPR